MPRSSANSAEESGRLFVVSGPSGVGKSTIVDGLARLRSFHFSVSATTRSPRPGETEGVDYLFVDRAGFERMIAEGELLEWATYGDDYYGTPRRPVEDALTAGSDVVLEIEVQGARQVRSAFPEAVLVFIAPPTPDVLETRLRGRGDTSPEAIARRLAIAREELAAVDEFDHVVVNHDLGQAIAELDRVMARYPGGQSSQETP
ncbi:MAG TPA: guanylate kinase [Acidimicrobiia bacterium]